MNTPSTPLPGTKAAAEAGCHCFRLKGTYDAWDDSLCVLHAPPPAPKPGHCEHGERAWSCSECRERELMNAAYESDLRGLRSPRTNAYGAEV